MSKILEGKLSNQSPRNNTSGLVRGVVKCAKCKKEIERPKVVDLQFENTSGRFQYKLYSYLQTPYFILESNSGKAVCYCSEACMKKHNHRFTK